jgi:hypothetical protein
MKRLSDFPAPKNSDFCLHPVISLSAPRRLHHLVMGAGAAVNKPVAENHRAIVDDLRHLIGF